MTSQRDAVVVGSGPNGLAAAIALAQAGRSVRVLEANDTIGGGCRSAELTLPGFVHDTCSAIHPLAMASPFFRTLPLEANGVEWGHPPIPLAHPLDDGTAAMLFRSIDETAAGLGEDAAAWHDVYAPLARDFDLLIDPLLGPFRLPRHPIAMARFGLPALLPAHRFARSRFDGPRARALFAGLAAHSILDLDKPVSAAFGLVLGLFGHVVGWPFPRGGSQRITDALVAHLRALGGEIVTGERVTSLAAAGEAEAVLFDLSPKPVLDIAGDALPGWYRRILGRYRYGAGVFKVDWALDGPVPWTAPACAEAGTLHLGGTMEEIVASEHAVASGRHPERPFVLVAQQSRFDPTRAPDGKHTLWGYCHVPNGSTEDMTDRIEAQVERFAPGFRDRIIARATMGTAAVQAANASYIGGDINAGIQDIRQLYTRPAPRWDPYSTPNPRLYICSAATPPGGGVHGMAGYHAARSALKKAW
jgi:phytoene dehydrogenase-like protein